MARIAARRSQLLMTYGVGSLFPAENTSWLISGLNHWDEEKLPFVIEPRLARQLGVRDLKSPPSTPDDRPRPNVPVFRFPRILQCQSCGAIGTIKQLQSPGRSPHCGICGDKAQLMPSRFVTSCSSGHLDEFPYFEWVHGFDQSALREWRRSPYPVGRPEKAPASAHVMRIRSLGRTSSLADLVIICSCKRQRSMEKAFNKSALKQLRCSGERPWLGRDYYEKGCTADRITVQRGASNLWFGNSASSISIPPYSGRITEIVKSERKMLDILKREALDAAIETGENDLLQGISNKYNNQFDVATLAQHARDILYPDDLQAVSETEFRFDEFNALMNGTNASDPDVHFSCREEPVGSGLAPWVSAVRRVSRLREVRVLSSFTRLTAAEQRDKNAPPTAGVLRPEDDGASWLPAIEMLGEGLFISLDHERLDQWASTPLATAHRSRLQANADDAATRASERSGNEVEANPVDIVHVAVHTLAHVLIDQLALEAGYPSSSLRERLFVGPHMAGILVYTATADSAGSLGGVASLADSASLERALTEAEERLSWCSADPVCIESTGSGTNGSNLAACHNCVLLPETSCEEFNTGLDRGVLFGTPDDPHGGMIGWLRSSYFSGSAGKPPTSEDAVQAAPEIVTDTPWQAIWQGAGDLAPLVEILAEEHAPVPEVQSPAGSKGIKVDLVWPSRQLAVVIDLADDDADSLEDEGWTVLKPEDEVDAGILADSVVKELKL